jgi:hypothetical protein
MYSSPNVIQNRNEHDLISDFKSEYEMYINNENILEYIENNTVLADEKKQDCNIKELLSVIYDNLFSNNVINKLDIDILNKWKSYF